MMISGVARRGLLLVPLILGLVAVSVSGLMDLSEPSQRLIAGALLGAFAVILLSQFLWHGRALLAHVGLAALSALATALMVLSRSNVFPILFFLLSPVATIHLSLKAGLVWIGLFIVATATVFGVINGLVGLASLLPYAAGFVFFGISGRLLVESESNRLRAEELLAELKVSHQRLQEYAGRLEELTIAQERNRIAREMHDTLGHRLTVASVQLEGAQRLIPTDSERAAQIVETVREQVKEGLTDLRRTVAMLRASVEEDLPLDRALTRLVEQVQQATELRIHVSLEGPYGELSAAQHQALYRAAQEALTNIQKHAHAAEAWLQLAVRAQMIEMLVSDNGVGISPERVNAGFGLVGLRERAALQGGELHVDARPGGGTQLTFRILLATEIPSRPSGESSGGTRG